MTAGRTRWSGVHEIVKYVTVQTCEGVYRHACSVCRCACVGECVDICMCLCICICKCICVCEKMNVRACVMHTRVRIQMYEDVLLYTK